MIRQRDVPWPLAPWLGLGLAAALMLPPAGPALERRMLTHMLLQLPGLFCAGALLAPWLAARLRASSWNLGGVPMLFAASLAAVFWMLPIALDHAVASVSWDLAKAASLAAAGAVAAASWPLAPAVVQAFFVGNGVWMGITAGQLYQAADSRLCNAYLLFDQAATGMAMTGLAILLGALWLAWMLHACRAAGVLRPPAAERQPASEPRAPKCIAERLNGTDTGLSAGLSAGLSTAADGGPK